MSLFNTIGRHNNYDRDKIVIPVMTGRSIHCSSGRRKTLQWLC